MNQKTMFMQSSHARLTTRQWEIMEKLLPLKQKAKYKLRDIVDAILWQLCAGQGSARQKTIGRPGKKKQVKNEGQEPGGTSIWSHQGKAGPQGGCGKGPFEKCPTVWSEPHPAQYLQGGFSAEKGDLMGNAPLNGKKELKNGEKQPKNSKKWPKTNKNTPNINQNRVEKWDWIFVEGCSKGSFSLSFGKPAQK